MLSSLNNVASTKKNENEKKKNENRKFCHIQERGIHKFDCCEELKESKLRYWFTLAMLEIAWRLPSAALTSLSIATELST